MCVILKQTRLSAFERAQIASETRKQREIGWWLPGGGWGGAEAGGAESTASLRPQIAPIPDCHVVRDKNQQAGLTFGRRQSRARRRAAVNQ